MYNNNFYLTYYSGSRRSAQEIVPLIVDMLNPKSVVDVGCGLGTWLEIFLDQGIDDILGIDGSWVNTELLKIPEEKFFKFDLKNPLFIDRKFDLAISLEVIEHLPPDCADIFIESLIRLSPVILFSAAIPHQGGDNHVNERWPTYWVDLFKKKDYVVTDIISKISTKMLLVLNEIPKLNIPVK